MDLGASPLQSIRRVLLPLLSPAIFASIAIVFASAIDNFVISQRVCADAGCQTIPIVIYASARRSPLPALNALATIVLVLSTTLIVAAVVIYRVQDPGRTDGQRDDRLPGAVASADRRGRRDPAGDRHAFHARRRAIVATRKPRRLRCWTGWRSLQERLWVEGTRSLLVVLQAHGHRRQGRHDQPRVPRDEPARASRSPRSSSPTAEELAHHFLWRIDRRLPVPGEVMIFNRSHYEDVLVVRVHELVPQDVWAGRYEEINAWERKVSESGTTIVKCFLHISFDEQRERLLARLDDPDEALEVQRRRHRRTRQVGGLSVCLRGCHRRVFDRCGAVVRRARGPQVVSQLGRGQPVRRDPGPARSAVPTARPGCPASAGPPDRPPH